MTISQLPEGMQREIRMGVEILQPLRINKDVLCLNLIRLVGITELMGVCVCLRLLLCCRE